MHVWHWHLHFENIKLNWLNEWINYLAQAGNGGWECYEPLSEVLSPSSLRHYVIDGLRRGSGLLSSSSNGPSRFWAWAFRRPRGIIVGRAEAGFGWGRKHGWVVEGQNVSPGRGQTTRSFGSVLRDQGVGAAAFDEVIPRRQNGTVVGEARSVLDSEEGVIAFAFGRESRRWWLLKDVSEELVIVSAVTLA